MQDQSALTEQLQKLLQLAHQNGLYDAADWIKARMYENQRTPNGSIRLHG